MIYEYKCLKCGNLLEKNYSVDERTSEEICSCGGAAVRHISPVAAHYKARGFPSNDFRHRSLGKQVVDSKVEDLFADHRWGKKYGQSKDHYGYRKGNHGTGE